MEEQLKSLIHRKNEINYRIFCTWLCIGDLERQTLAYKSGLAEGIKMPKPLQRKKWLPLERRRRKKFEYVLCSSALKSHFILCSSSAYVEVFFGLICSFFPVLIIISTVAFLRI